MKKNLGTIDRLVRVIVAESLVVLGLFWLSSDYATASYILAAIIFLTVLFGYSPSYHWFGIRTTDKNFHRLLNTILWLFIIIVPVAGGFGSNWLTKIIFLRDAERINKTYNQLLQSIKLHEREKSVRGYREWLGDFVSFGTRYHNYQPFFIRYDKFFKPAIEEVADITGGVSRDIYQGSLDRAQEDLESIGPLVSGFLKSGR